MRPKGLDVLTTQPAELNRALPIDLRQSFAPCSDGSAFSPTPFFTLKLMPLVGVNGCSCVHRSLLPSFRHILDQLPAMTDGVKLFAPEQTLTTSNKCSRTHNYTKLGARERHMANAQNLQEAESSGPASYSS